MIEPTPENIEALKVAYRRERGLAPDAPVEHIIGAADVYLFTTITKAEGAGRVLTFDRLGTGELVALVTHEGRSVAAIVHPVNPEWESSDQWERRWAICGDVDPHRRPTGSARTARTACGEAAEALAVELGIEVDGWEVPT